MFSTDLLGGATQDLIKEDLVYNLLFLSTYIPWRIHIISGAITAIYLLIYSANDTVFFTGMYSKNKWIYKKDIYHYSEYHIWKTLYLNKVNLSLQGTQLFVVNDKLEFQTKMRLLENFYQPLWYQWRWEGDFFPILLNDMC